MDLNAQQRASGGEREDSKFPDGLGLFNGGKTMVMKTHPYLKHSCIKLALGSLLLLGAGVMTAFAQDGPPVPPRLGWPIDYFRFIDTNWNSTRGFAPRSFSGIEGVEGWWTNVAMRIAGSGPAWLQYDYVNTNTNGSRTNIMFPEGGLKFRFIRQVCT